MQYEIRRRNGARNQPPEGRIGLDEALAFLRERGTAAYLYNVMEWDDLGNSIGYGGGEFLRDYADGLPIGARSGSESCRDGSPTPEETKPARYCVRVSATAMMTSSIWVEANSERDARVKALDKIANGGVDWKYDGMTDEPATINSIERKTPAQSPSKQIRWVGKLVKIGDLRVGQVVDIRGDRYADPGIRYLSEHTKVVEDIVFCNEEAVRVVFVDSESVVFPPEHQLLCVGRLETASDRRG